MAQGLEQGGWGLQRVSKGLGGLGPGGLVPGEGQGAGVRGGLDPQGTSGHLFVCSLVRSFDRTDGKFTPLSYRTSSPSGPLPKKLPYVVVIWVIVPRGAAARKVDQILLTPTIYFQIFGHALQPYIFAFLLQRYTDLIGKKLKTIFDF